MKIIKKVPITLIRHSNPPSVFIDTSHTSPDAAVDKMQDPYSYFRNIFITELLQNLTNDAETYNWKLCRLMVGFALLLQKYPAAGFKFYALLYTHRASDKYMPL